MVTKKPVTAVQDAATFDVAAWLEELQHKGFKPRNVTVKLHYRADLLPRIQELLDQIQKFQDGPEREVGVDEADPMDELVAEYNALTEEFLAAGSLDFVFKPRTSKIAVSTYNAWSEKHAGEKDPSKEDLILSRMAATCISHPGITAEAFAAFEEAYGSPTFQALMAGFVDAYEGGSDVAAPFSPSPLPTPGTDG